MCCKLWVRQPRAATRPLGRCAVLATAPLTPTPPRLATRGVLGRMWMCVASVHTGIWHELPCPRRDRGLNVVSYGTLSDSSVLLAVLCCFSPSAQSNLIRTTLGLSSLQFFIRSGASRILHLCSAICATPSSHSLHGSNLGFQPLYSGPCRSSTRIRNSISLLLINPESVVQTGCTWPPFGGGI